MVTSLIFDLDQTLVDSSISQDARRLRAWSDVYSLIPSFTLFEGIRELCEYIEANAYKTCIISTAPKKYVEKVVRYHNLPFSNIVGYHDARIKPAPDGMLLALKLMNSSPLETISFGDKCDDILASNRAGIPSAACFWGASEQNKLQSISSTYKFFSPLEVLTFLSKMGPK